MPSVRVRAKVTAEACAAEASDVCFAYNARARPAAAQVIGRCDFDQLPAAKRSMAVKARRATASCDDEHEDAHGGTGSELRVEPRWRSSCGPRPASVLPGPHVASMDEARPQDGCDSARIARDGYHVRPGCTSCAPMVVWWRIVRRTIDRLE